ncbi:MAG: NrfD/PsrC family molybdoenzyme membrane anchor subunit [Candidatus Methanomethyliaceae archaeon]
MAGRATHAILLVLAVAGLGTWTYQVVNGLGVTAMSNIVSWGLYITAFVFLVGLSAGGLIVSSSATVFNLKPFKAVAKPAVLLSAVCIILAVLFIFVDLGRPERFLNLILSPRVNSPLIWDVVVIAAYLIISLLYLYYLDKPDTKESTRHTFSAIALPTAVLVHSITAWIFGLQIARPVWHTALLAPLFVISALDSGLAMLLLVLMGLERLGYMKLEKSLLATLAGLLAVLVMVDVFFVFSEILTALYPAEERMMAYIDLLLDGSLAPFFWGEIILGVVIPFVLLVVRARRESKTVVGIASACVVVGVFFKRVWLLFSAYLLPLINNPPGITLGKYQVPATETWGSVNIWATAGSYTPTLVEWLIFVGIFAFGALLYTWGARYLLAAGRKREVETDGTAAAGTVQV